MKITQRTAVMRAMPPRLRIAVRLMYAGAGFSAVGVARLARILQIGEPRTVAYQVDEIIRSLVVAGCVAGLWLLMSWNIRRGREWARVLSAVFFGLGAPIAIAGLVAGGWVSAVILTLAALTGLSCVILLYQRESSTFFAPGHTLPGYDPAPGLGSVTSYGTPPTHRRRILAIIAVSTAAVLLVTAAVVADGLTGRPGGPGRKALSTANIRVIVPAPATAGGLRQDYADEKTPTFRSALAALRHRYLLSPWRDIITSFTIALYTSAQPGTPRTETTVLLIYVGTNTRADVKDKGTATDLVGGAVAHMTDVRAISLPGGPGDTTYACASGVIQGRHAVVCGWVTDRSSGLLIQFTPNGTAGKLAAVMYKMRPDLVRS